MVFQLLYNLADALFISQIDRQDPSYAGGLGLVFPVILTIIAFTNGMMIGISSLTARSIGRRDTESLEKVLSSGALIAVVLALTASIVVLGFSRPLIMALGGQGDFLRHGDEYIRVLIRGVGILCYQQLVLGLLQGEGNTRCMMWSQIIGTTMNLVLDPLFIFTFSMGVRGAAAATVTSQLFSACYLTWVLIRKPLAVHYRLSVRMVDLKVTGEILRVGLPQSLSMLMTSMLVMFLNRIIISIDTMALTAITFYSRFESFLIIPIHAIATAVISLVGQNMGRGYLTRSREIYRVAVRLSLLVTSGFYVLFLIISPRIFSFMSSIEAIRTYTFQMSLFLGPGLVITSIGIIGQNTFQALGQASKSLFLTVLRLFVCIIPTVLFAVYVLDLGIIGILLGIVFGDIGFSLGSLQLVRRTFRQSVGDDPAAVS